MKSALELLLQRLEKSGFTKEAQSLTHSHISAGENDAANALEQPDMPTRLGAFEILGQLGEGGYGFVYLGAQHSPVKRTAAIKILKKGMDSQAILQRFRAEQQAMAIMEHPNVATIFESGCAQDGRPWFAMPLVAGLPIHLHCDLELCTISDRVKLFMAACDGVVHAHQRGILHRDLKPANILISFEDHHAIPKVIDFGIAKAVEGADPLSSLTTRAAVALGTPAYMSPEQFRGETDVRSDIWALGIILGELLCGVRPLRCDPVRQEDGRVAEPQPERPSERFVRLVRENPKAALEVAQQRGVAISMMQSQLRGDLDAIVLKCLELDRERRYQSVSELVDDLRRYVAGEVVEARPPSLFYQSQRFIRRRRLQVTAVSAVLIAMIVATIVSVRSARRANEEKEAATAVTQFLVETITAADPFGASGAENISLREVLSAASKRFTEHPHNRPSETIAIATALGGTLTQVGQAKEAMPLLESAVELSYSEFGPLSREYFIAQEKKALALQALGNMEEALKIYQSVVASARTIWNKDDTTAANTLVNFGLVERDAGHADAAEKLFREAIDRTSELQGQERLQLASALGNLGVLLQEVGRFEEAEPLMKSALNINLELLGDSNATVAGDYHNLSFVQKDLNQMDQAESNLRLALKTMRATAGVDHPSTALLLNSLAQLLQERGKVAEAETTFHEALTVYLKKFPADHPDVARVQNNLAFCVRNQGRLAEAEILFRQSLASNQSRLGPDHPDVIISLNNLAKLLQDQGQLAAALEYSTESVQKSRKIFEKSDPRLWVFIGRRGAILAAMNRLAEADADLQESLSGLENIHAPVTRTKLVLNELVNLHTHWATVEPASTHAQQAQQWRDKLEQLNASKP